MTTGNNGLAQAPKIRNGSAGSAEQRIFGKMTIQENRNATSKNERKGNAEIFFFMLGYFLSRLFTERPLFDDNQFAFHTRLTVPGYSAIEGEVPVFIHGKNQIR